MTAKQFVKKNSSIIATFVIAFLLLIIVSIVKVGYSSPANLKVLSISIGVLGLTALGQTFPILIGGMVYQFRGYSVLVDIYVLH